MSKETISPVDSYSRKVSKLLLKADRSAERNLIILIAESYHEVSKA